MANGNEILPDTRIARTAQMAALGYHIHCKLSAKCFYGLIPALDFSDFPISQLPSKRIAQGLCVWAEMAAIWCLRLTLGIHLNSQQTHFVFNSVRLLPIHSAGWLPDQANRFFWFFLPTLPHSSGQVIPLIYLLADVDRDMSLFWAIILDSPALAAFNVCQVPH